MGFDSFSYRASRLPRQPEFDLVPRLVFCPLGLVPTLSNHPGRAYSAAVASTLPLEPIQSSDTSLTAQGNTAPGMPRTGIALSGRTSSELMTRDVEGELDLIANTH